MKHFLILLFLLSAFSLTAQDKPKPVTTVAKRMLLPTDSIEFKPEGSRKFLLHQLKAGQTLYGIASYYGLDVADLYHYNPSFRTQVPQGAVVKIPISKHDIHWSMPKGKPKWRMIEVVYVVKPKDTFFKIAKVYLDMPTDSLKALNRLDTTLLEVGKRLVIGWIDIDGVPQKVGVRSWLPNDLYDDYKSLKARFVASQTGTQIKESGPAVWNKGMKSSQLYALHPTAPIGTVMKVTNPINRRTVFVKIVGQMQTAGYRYDTILVLSPACVKSLGGVNHTFKVNVEYYLSPK